MKDDGNIPSSLIPALPTTLIARILSYYVVTIKDVAQLRLMLGKTISQQVMHLLPLEISHWIRCPERIHFGTDDVNNNINNDDNHHHRPPRTRSNFVQELCSIPWYEWTKHGGIMRGDDFVVPGDQATIIDSPLDEDVESSATTTTTRVLIRVVDMWRFEEDITKRIIDQETDNLALATATSCEEEHLEMIQQVCDIVEHATDETHLISQLSPFMHLFKPAPGSDTTTVADTLIARTREADDHKCFCLAMASMVTLEIDPSAPYIHKTVHANNHTFYQINLVRTSIIPRESNNEELNATIPLFQPLYPGGTVWAVDAGQARRDGVSRRMMVHSLLYLFGDCYRITAEDNYYHTEFSHRTLLYNKLVSEFQQHQCVEGVVIVDDFVNDEFQKLLNDQVNALAAKQEQDQAVDYHPHSNNVVRDLVHPALYSYIQGVTPHLISKIDDVPVCQFPGVPHAQSLQETDKDFWGRAYETSKYQWLPSYVSISHDGKCTFDTYINNLTPKDDPVHSSLYKSLETLLGHALPFIESVMTYVYAVRPMVRHKDDDQQDYANCDLGDPKPLPLNFINLRGQKLQVIPKIVDYELTPQHDSYEGVWHVEGMSHEEIVLTCLYILDRDDTIEGGEIQYKRAFLMDEVNYIWLNIHRQFRPEFFDTLLVDQELCPLGTVATPRGRLLVFPNSHIHRVKAMKIARQHQENEQSNDGKDTANVAKRRIVVFFVVNPQRRIVSTREVAPQQLHSGGSLPHEEALEHRLALMTERKFHKQDWNVRHVELCEH